MRGLAATLLVIEMIGILWGAYRSRVFDYSVWMWLHRLQRWRLVPPHWTRGSRGIQYASWSIRAVYAAAAIWVVYVCGVLFESIMFDTTHHRPFNVIVLYLATHVVFVYERRVIIGSWRHERAARQRSNRNKRNGSDHSA